MSPGDRSKGQDAEEKEGEETRGRSDGKRLGARAYWRAARRTSCAGPQEETGRLRQTQTEVERHVRAGVRGWQNSAGRFSSYWWWLTKLLGILVDLVGIEPTTSSMPWKRAPSCATGPRVERKGKTILAYLRGLVKRPEQSKVWWPRILLLFACAEYTLFSDFHFARTVVIASTSSF
jgi:hypothetical protein